MSYLEISRKNNEDRAKARTLDGMEKEAQARNAYSAGNAQGTRDSRDAIEQALTERLHAKMGHDMERGVNYQPEGPSFREEISAFASDAAGRVGDWFRGGVDFVTGAEADENMRRQGAAEQLRQEQYRQENIPNNMTPAQMREAALEYARSNAGGR